MNTRMNYAHSRANITSFSAATVAGVPRNFTPETPTKTPPDPPCSRGSGRWRPTCCVRDFINILQTLLRLLLNLRRRLHQGTDQTLGHAMSDFHQPSISILMPSLFFFPEPLQQMLPMPLLRVARLSRGRGVMWRHDALSRTSCSQCRNAKLLRQRLMTRAAAVRCTLTPLSPSFAHARRKATVDRGHPQHTSCRRWLRRHCSCSDSSCCSKRCDGAMPSSACGCRPSARTGQRPKMGHAAAAFSTRDMLCRVKRSNCSKGEGSSCC